MSACWALAAALFVAAPSDDEVRATLEELREAQARANDEPAAGAAALEALLAEIERDPDTLRAVPELVEARQRARLVLARAQLMVGQTDEARGTMDKVVREAWPDEVPASDYGPRLGELYAARRELLAERGEGVLELACATPCEAWVEARRLEGPRRRLLLGDYDVVVQGLDAPDTRARHRLELHGESFTIAWEPPPSEGPAPAPADVGAEPRRVLPRWASGLGIGIGAAATGAGVALLIIDGRCPGGDSPDDPIACPSVYETTAGGASLTGAGAAVLTSAIAILIVDEVRRRRSRR